MTRVLSPQELKEKFKEVQELLLFSPKVEERHQEVIWNIHKRKYLNRWNQTHIPKWQWLIIINSMSPLIILFKFIYEHFIRFELS